MTIGQLNKNNQIQTYISNITKRKEKRSTLNQIINLQGKQGYIADIVSMQHNNKALQLKSYEVVNKKLVKIVESKLIIKV